MEYGKIIDGSLSCSCNTYEFPKVIDLKFTDVQPEGYLPIQKVQNKPQVPQGKWLAFTYVNKGDCLQKDYFLVDEGQSAIEHATIYSKYKIVRELMSFGIWTSTKQIMTDNGLFDLWEAAQEFKSDDPYFIQGVQIFKDEFETTDDRIQQILEKCIKD